jgi:hypothetical protein
MKEFGKLFVLHFSRHKTNILSHVLYTVIIFLAQNGRIRTVKFRPQNFGRISFDLGEISPNQQILRLNNGRNSPKSEEIRPKFLRANLNCADSPGSPEKISTVYEASKNMINFSFNFNKIIEV